MLMASDGHLYLVTTEWVASPRPLWVWLFQACYSQPQTRA